MVHGGAAVPHPFGISLFEHNVYFTDWTKMAVMKANKFTDSSPQIVYSTSQTPHGVAVIHQLKQPYGEPFIEPYVSSGRHMAVLTVYSVGCTDLFCLVD